MSPDDRGYEFPGGKVEPNEEADQAAIRELSLIHI
ncbi:NUDIX domain-containing protein [Bacillus pumilus]|nr:NUDIX domain-containing protein [Bacillus pumilus]